MNSIFYLELMMGKCYFSSVHTYCRAFDVGAYFLSGCKTEEHAHSM